MPPPDEQTSLESALTRPRDVRVLRLENGSGATLENVLRISRALGVLDSVLSALDPYAHDVGRLRADENLPKRVRPRAER